MGQIANLIIPPARIARTYAERLLSGIARETFARKAAVNGKVIDSNHPAWVYGHLATYPAKLAAMLTINGDANRFAAPSGFDDLFKDKTECRDDPSGTIYPAMDTITSAYFKTHDALLEALSGVDDARFLAQTPDEKARERFPLVGARISFMLNNHVTTHLGQISTWRRCMGLPSAF